MRVIRASELGTYQFCNRAWWYHLQGYEPDNRLAIQSGKSYHAKHSFVVNSTGCLQALAYSLMLLAMISASIWLIQTFL